MTALTWIAIIGGITLGLVVLAATVLLVIVGVNDRRWRAEHANHPSGHVHPTGPPRVAP